MFGKAALRHCRYDTNMVIRQRHKKITDDFLGDTEPWTANCHWYVFVQPSCKVFFCGI
jgi:hypothetical protein